MDKGLVCAFEIDGRGNARQLDEDEISSPIADGHWRWLHFDRVAPDLEAWMDEKSGLTRPVIDILLQVETRPRLKVIDDDAVLVLRGVNLNPHANAEDMIAVRVSVEQNRVITSRHVKMMAIDALRRALLEGHGPRTIGDFVCDLADGLTERMGPIVSELTENADELEDSGAKMDVGELRRKLTELRHKLIPLRRYLRPQQDALQSVIAAPLAWLSEVQKARLRDTHDRLTRYIEDLDAARDRADVVQDWLSTDLSDRTNSIMLLLSVVTTVFLPLGLISGILGMNVSGIPGANYPWAFAIVLAGMAFIAGILLWLFRRSGII